MKKLALSLVLVASVVTACSSSDDGGSSGGAATNEITVTSNTFTPATLTIKVGETVTWKWAGGTHNVVSGASCTSDNAYTSGAPTSTVGNVFTHTYTTAGQFPYFCNPHCSNSAMQGVITVQ